MSSRLRMRWIVGRCIHSFFKDYHHYLAIPGTYTHSHLFHPEWSSPSCSGRKSSPCPIRNILYRRLISSHLCKYNPNQLARLTYSQVFLQSLPPLQSYELELGIFLLSLIFAFINWRQMMKMKHGCPPHAEAHSSMSKQFRPNGIALPRSALLSD